LAISFVSISGLLSYMLYQYAQFGEPLAFAKTQEHWFVVPKVPMGERLFSLAILEPVWRAFDSSSKRYIFLDDPSQNPFTSALLWHIFLWLLAGVLLMIGIRKKEITSPEAIAWAGLWLMPYFLRGHEMAMHSQGRFVSVIVPMYLVLGKRLLHAPEVVRWSVVILLGYVQMMLLMQFVLYKTVI
jgi:hypothetical protein